MLNKSKFTSASATVILLTSVLLGAQKDNALANPLSKLWRNFKTAGNSLTLVNPFKSTGSANLNRPNSNAKLSTDNQNKTNIKTPKTLWTRFKNLFSSSGNKPSSTSSTTTFKNPTFEDSPKPSTITHTLKGSIKTTSKSKEKRARLAAAYDNDAESLTSDIISSSNDSGSINNKQSSTKNKLKSSNPSVSFDQLSISSEDSSSSSETKTNSNRNSISNSDLIPDLKSELEVRKIQLGEELENKILLEKDINRSNDLDVKQSLGSHLKLSEEKITNLKKEIKTIQKLIKDIQN